MTICERNGFFNSRFSAQVKVGIGLVSLMSWMMNATLLPGASRYPMPGGGASPCPGRGDFQHCQTICVTA